MKAEIKPNNTKLIVCNGSSNSSKINNNARNIDIAIENDITFIFCNFIG